MNTNQSPFRRCDGVTRRDLLRVGGLTALGIGVRDLFALRRAMAEQGSEKRGAAKAKRCILIWLDGGPSHLETFDLKPEAPAEVRGPLKPRATKVPGIHVSECLPRTAMLMNKVAVIRSMTSPLGEHNFGTHYLMTGYKPTPVLEYPAFGAVLAHCRTNHGVLPANIAVPSFRVGGGRLSGSGFLPAATRPFPVGGDASKPNFKVRDLEFYKGVDVMHRRKAVQIDLPDEVTEGDALKPSTDIDDLASALDT
ncbi:MAG: DUF1501 domain-containing protein, partial [Proteobacteria bacterium]|nr:DUF1501 domain-containing protein [Pseudomonadota bacterium]